MRDADDIWGDPTLDRLYEFLQLGRPGLSGSLESRQLKAWLQWTEENRNGFCLRRLLKLPRTPSLRFPGLQPGYFRVKATRRP